MAKVEVYKSNETDFLTNGPSLIDSTLCVIEEELNGKYTLELEHPIFGNERHLLLVEGNIIKASGQLFRIHKTIGSLGYKQVFARHIFYDLLHNFLEDVRPTGLNGNNALNWILNNTQYPHRFIGVSDVSTIATQYFIRKNPVEAILGADSLSTRWGGELVRDNFIIKLLRVRGANKGAKIAYGKNLLGLEVERDMDSLATRIMPVGKDGLLLPEKYIDSPLINNYAHPFIKTVEFDDGVIEATEGESAEEAVTEEQAFASMRQKVADMYELGKVDIPYININANLVLLENTEEYKDLKHLVKVDLGDTVSCTDNPLNIEFEAKVIRVKKDVLANRNVEVELGQFKKGIGETIKDVLGEVKEELELNKSDLEKAINRATELLTNALGGYVIKRAGEILIMDTEDPLTATEVWRWSLKGLGYSGTGIDGPYRLAITMDGQIVADFITTGTLNAQLVKTGVLASKDNSVWINLDSSDFNFKDQIVWNSVSKKLILGADTVLSWASISNPPNIPIKASDIGALPNTTQIPVLPSYIQSTYISNAEIRSGTITGSVIKTSSAGKRIVLNESNSNSIRVYSNNDSLAFIMDYDILGTGTESEAEKRVFLRTENGHALKLMSQNANMSIQASGGSTIFIKGNVNFTDGRVRGVNAPYYATNWCYMDYDYTGTSGVSVRDKDGNVLGYIKLTH